MSSCKSESRFSSPNGKLSAILSLNDKGSCIFSILLNNQLLFENSQLGIKLADESHNFNEELQFEGVEVKAINESYSMMVGKQSNRRDECNEVISTYTNAAGEKIDIIIRLYNDAFAFSYKLFNKYESSVVQEYSKFSFKTIKNTWSIPYSSGEEKIHVKKSIGKDLEEQSLSFPVLIEMEDDGWALVTESDVSNYPLSSGQFQGQNMSYVFSNEKIAKNRVESNFKSPWRVLMLSNTLAGIVENCTVDHLAPKSKINDTSWIEPGVTSFPWWGNNMANSCPDSLKAYIDLSAKMKWRYFEFDLPLIGSPGRAIEKWKTTGWIKDVVDNGLSNGVLCYGWDELKNLNTVEKRKEIFSKYKEFGIRGIKVDFVNSYTQETRILLEDLIQDAIKYKLMVSFHGAQGPRGFARTYPNLMTYEAVKGTEYYLDINGARGLTAEHNCTLPFTRNVIGSMDYVPCAFSTELRETTMAHELATAIIFESGWQGFCDVPEAYLNSDAVPILKDMPSAWDETKFLVGYPGKYVCLARRKGKTWYVAGINAGPSKTLELVLPFRYSGNVKLYNDLSDDLNSLRVFDAKIHSDKPMEVMMRKNGGFIFSIQVEE